MAWVDRHADYLAACVRHAVALREDHTTAFKQDPDYAGVVGNDRRGAAMTNAFLDGLLANGHPIDVLQARVLDNDRHGAPRLHRIQDHNWSTGSLRYLQVALELERAGVTSVIEIGGGYGGQRLLCRDVLVYQIIDLPEALELQRAYLGLQEGIFPTAFRDTVVVHDIDLPLMTGTCLLSDFALSELDSVTMAQYIDELGSRCASGRVTCAATRTAELTHLLEPYFASITVEPEAPRTSARIANEVIHFQHHVIH